MPFDEKEFQPKNTLKEINGQKSMFDGKPRPPTQQEFQKKVQDTEDKQSDYQKRSYELAMQFMKMIADKTLPQNRNILNNEAERETLQKMVKYAQETNNDPNVREGEGSLTWITLLFKTCLNQRDRLNEMEFAIIDLRKKTDPRIIEDLVQKEVERKIVQPIDNETKK